MADKCTIIYESQQLRVVKQTQESQYKTPDHYICERRCRDAMGELMSLEDFSLYDGLCNKGDDFAKRFLMAMLREYDNAPK